MQEHPAARQFDPHAVSTRISLESQISKDKNSRNQLSSSKNTGSEPQRIGDLPEFLIFVYKTKQYDPL